MEEEENIDFFEEFDGKNDDEFDEKNENEISRPFLFKGPRNKKNPPKRKKLSNFFPPEYQLSGEESFLSCLKRGRTESCQKNSNVDENNLHVILISSDSEGEENYQSFEKKKESSLLGHYKAIEEMRITRQKLEERLSGSTHREFKEPDVPLSAFMTTTHVDNYWHYSGANHKNTAPNQPTSLEKTVVLEIRDEKGQMKICVLGPNEMFGLAFEKYCKSTEQKRERVEFIRDKKIINDSDTPETHNLNDEAVIEVRPKPLGGEMCDSPQVYRILPPKRACCLEDRLEVHFRIAESQFLRLGGMNTFQLISVEYHINPVLVSKFTSTEKLFREKYGETEESNYILGFHGTNPKNIPNILAKNFDLQKLGSYTGNRGWYGAGIYFSEFPNISVGYSGGSQKLLLCKILPGKTFDVPEKCIGSSCKPGYDSHRFSPDNQGRGKELVIFNVDQILPCYVVEYGSLTR